MAIETFRRDRLTWLSYILLAFFGYFLNILGPITPFLKSELRLSYTVSSLHFTAFAAGILLVGTAGHLIIRRLGRWTSMWIGTFGMSVGALLLVAGRSPAITIGASFCMGLVGSFILVVVPSALSDQHAEGRAVAFTEANLVASVVATVAPLLVGWTSHLPGGWRLAIGFGAALPLVIRPVFGKAKPEQRSAQSVSSQPAGPPLPFGYWVYWGAIFFAVSVEFCMIFWAADYLQIRLGLLKDRAAQSVSLFLGAMIVGRFAGSRAVRSLSSKTVIVVALFVAGAGFALFWLTYSAATVLAGLFVTGLGVSALYPLILSLAVGTAKDNAVEASARATLASGGAVFALPLVLGRLADLFGIQKAYGVVAALIFAVMLIIVLAPTTVPVRPAR